MPALTDHPCFLQPFNQDIKLWRYMDFTKFVSLISSKSLFFCRADKFKDPFEGTYPKFNQLHRQEIYKDWDSKMHQAWIEQVISRQKIYKENVFISCWHANQYESAAMWELYSQANDAIAIETDYASLKALLPDHILLGMVNYIDYENEWMPEHTSFFPFMHKRKSFDHEKEARAVIDISYHPEIKESPSGGLNINIDLNTLIKTIHISPAASGWFKELVMDISSKYEITAKVSKSDLYSDPLY